MPSLAVESVIVEERRRTDFGDIEGLAESIRRYGLLHPIVVDQQNRLIVGERRLRAHKLLKLDTIEVKFYEDLDEFARREIELDENIRRKAFDWQEECRAIQEYHDLHANRTEGWTLEQTAERLGMTYRQVAKYVSVQKEIEKGNTAVLAASGISAANAIVSRATKREIDNEIASLIDLKDSEAPETTDEIPVEVYHADFKEWAKHYTGPKFHFLHVDPPYGIDHHQSAQGGVSSFTEMYEDSPEKYWEFLAAIAHNADRILSAKSHIMLWLSMKFYSDTIEFFKEEFSAYGVRTFYQPMIWHKSDNTAMAPDVTREPRRIYENALLISLGDRQIIKAQTNLYAAPAAKHLALHPSAKPAEMLRYFFEMFVDSSTRVLDPCCGGGTSLEAAIMLGALQVVGLDISKDFADIATTAAKNARYALSALDT